MSALACRCTFTLVGGGGGGGPEAQPLNSIRTPTAAMAVIRFIASLVSTNPLSCTAVASHSAQPIQRLLIGAGQLAAEQPSKGLFAVLAHLLAQIFQVIFPMARSSRHPQPLALAPRLRFRRHCSRVPA